MQAEDRKSIVQDTYDQEADRYKTASTMQLYNQTQLLALASPLLTEIKPARILDVGCGQGAAAAMLKQLGWLASAEYLGIDLSPQMIENAKEAHASDAVKFATGDAEALQVADGWADFTLSNVALHWLNQPKFGLTLAKAFSELHRVLRSGGVLAVSTPAVGKAERFLRAYRSVLVRYAGKGLDRSQYVEDPINRLHLHELVDLALRQGFTVEAGQMRYQPQSFASAQDYLVAARAYGYTCFVAPLAPELRESAWGEICTAFGEDAGSGPYIHDLYIAYVIARK